MPQTFYDILGVQPAATAEEIKRAYRKLARQLHPDKNPAPEATKKFALLASAYETLSDRSRRRAYDTVLERGGRVPQPEAEEVAPTDRRAHYSWMNIASESSDPAQPGNQRNGKHSRSNGTLNGRVPTELDEMYDAYFGGGARPGAKRKTKPHTRSSSD